MKRYFSLLLVAILVVTSLSVTAFAVNATPGQTGVAVPVKISGEFANVTIQISSTDILTVKNVTGITYNESNGKAIFFTSENVDSISFTVIVDVSANAEKNKSYGVDISILQATKLVDKDQDTEDGTKDGLVAADVTVSGGVFIPCDHATSNWSITNAATCTKDGEKALICDICSATLATEVIPATGHKVDGQDWVTTKEPACTKEGEKVKYCSVCGEVAEEAAIDALGHNTDGQKWVTTKEPTCTEDGLKVKYCSVCGEVAKEKTIDAGHDWNMAEWGMDDDYHYHTCSVCGEKKDIEKHTMEWKIDKHPSYVSTGLKHEYCVICGHTHDPVVMPMKVKDPDLDDVPPTGDITPTVNYGAFAILIAMFSVVALVFKRRTAK